MDNMNSWRTDYEQDMIPTVRAACSGDWRLAVDLILDCLDEEEIKRVYRTLQIAVAAVNSAKGGHHAR